MQNTKFGNPNTKTDIDYGPLINEDGSKKVSELVNSAKSSGADVTGSDSLVEEIMSGKIWAANTSSWPCGKRA